MRLLQCVALCLFRLSPTRQTGPGFSRRTLRMEGGRPYITTWLVIVASPIRRGSLSRRSSWLHFLGAGCVAAVRSVAVAVGNPM